MPEVESSFIAEVDYYEDEEVLEIKFKGNPATYVYFGVEAKTAEEFLLSDSLGRFYGDNIKGFYSSFKH